MIVDEFTAPRKFVIGAKNDIVVKHTANIKLDDNEQVTFITGDGSEFDVMKKKWGYYASPSLNKRLISFGFKSALVQNKAGQVYLMIVHEDKITDFNDYCKKEDQKVLMWVSSIMCHD